MFRRLLVFPCLLVAGAAFAATPPEWLLAAARRPTPALPAGAPALVLLDETAYSVQPDGRCIVEHRFAVRVINRSGTEHARGSVDYLEKRDSIRSTAAWLVRAAKEVRPPQKRDWIDVTDAASGAVYDESRSRAVSYTDLAIEGDVFGYETKLDRRMLFGQVGYEWGSSLPVLTERFSLSLPPSWACDPLLEGPEAASVAVATGGQSWTWELRDRPYRPDEPAMAERARRDARLMASLRPAPDAKAGLILFGSWSEVADWDRRNSAGQCDTDPALAATVQKLIAGSPDALGRIKALSRHVQQLRYVGVNKGLALGMGYRPRKATEVQAKGWGDCKDKANLLRAMLREAGIESFDVSALLGGGRFVNPAWPSPMQFNHAIVAIRVDDSVALPAIVEVPGLGRLLFFDATDPDTLVGDLPWALQGARVHVLAPGGAGLTTLPVLPTETNHVFATKVQLELSGGGVTGKCSFGGPGRAGAVCRGLARTKSEKDQRTFLGEWVNGTVRGAQIQDLAASDDPVSGERWINFGFSSPRFGQQMPGGLMLLRFDILSRDSVPAFPEKERRLAVALRPILHRDEVRLQLPAGSEVDEMPPPAELRSAFGSYASSYEVAGEVIISRRVLRLEDRTVPVAEYPALRQFLADVAKADRASLIIRCAAAGGAPAK